jgi:3',5'-cyclic AMP phosphodiesterase CpdA
LRIIHVSDIHFWRYSLNPLNLLSKRAFGMAALALGRARRFRLERVADLVERVKSLEPDHILITGDVTTTALPSEFLDARTALAPWLADPSRVTVIPGNHDRYTLTAHFNRHFEHHFGAYAPEARFPWIKPLDAHTAILTLDPTRAGLSASGKLPARQLEDAKRLIESANNQWSRLIVACHYPASVPDQFAHEIAKKPLVNAALVRDWLRTIGPHLYCCGHVHSAWAFQPREVPEQLCLNAGAPLLNNPKASQPPGFLEIQLDHANVTVLHHAHSQSGWSVRTLAKAPGFFEAGHPT